MNKMGDEPVIYNQNAVHINLSKHTKVRYTLMVWTVKDVILVQRSRGNSAVVRTKGGNGKCMSLSCEPNNAAWTECRR